MTWVVPLAGNQADLARLALSLTDAACSVSQDGQGYVLRSDRFSPDLDARGVLDEANKIVTAINGSTRLIVPHAKPVSVASVNRVHDNGRRDINVFLEPAIINVTLIAPTIRMTHPDGTIEESHPADPLKELVPLSFTDETVSKVLELLSSGPLGWVSLCKVWEIVAADVGGIGVVASKGWATMSAIELLKHTAQHPESAGLLGSRHGALNSEPPQKPMPLLKARILIESLVHNWLRDKVDLNDISV